MAEVVITTRVNNELVEKSINNFKDLKREIRASKDELLKYAEGSEDFKRVQQNVSKLQTSLKDLGDTARIQGSGVERLTQSFNLLGDAFTSGDIEKGKIAFTGIGQAMSAIPIFLLIEGIQLLIQNFDEVVKVAKSFTDVAKEQAIAVRNLSIEYDAIANNLDEIAFMQDKLIKNAEFETKILLEQAKQRGASIAELDKIETDGNARKLEILQKAEKNYLAQKEFADSQYFKALKTNDEELIKRAKETLIVTTNEYRKSKEATIEAERAANLAIEQNKTEAIERQRNQTKKVKEVEKEESNKDFEDVVNRLYAQQDKEVEIELEKRDRIEEIQRQQDDREFKARIDATKKRIQLAEQEAEKEKQIKKAVQDATFTSISNGFNAANNISKIYYQSQLNQAKGNAQAETEIRKKQFEVEKAFSVARAVIDGIRSVQGALAQTATLGPAATVLAVSNGVLAAANVAAILATKFDGGASASQTTPTNTITEPPTQTAPTLPQFGESGSTQLQGGNGTINQTNQPLTVRAIVLESDITNTQNTVNKERRTATFG